MKIEFYKIAVLFIVFTLAFEYSFSQTVRKNQSKDAAVLLSVKTSVNPPKIILSWEKHPLAYRYEVRRKLFGDLIFPTIPITSFDSTQLVFEDSTVEIGKEYEYEVRAYYRAYADFTFRRDDGTTYDTTIFTFFAGIGYVHTGVNVPPRHSFGRVLVLVDETIATDIGIELQTFESDLISEGWSVVRRYVPRAETFDPAKVKQVKEIILEEYGKSPTSLNTIVLIGRVPVPYSGQIAPDGHPDHLGAWPCDMYYGSLFEDFWTDYNINTTTASDPRNRNIPGDGKFDPSSPSGNSIDLAVGRIDFYNMPKFSQSEIELIKQYLDKNHKYRTGELRPERRGIIDDNFGANRYLNAFASSGYRNFAALLGPQNINVKDWFSTLKTDSYIWGYGCGGGTYTSAGGIGSTDDFVKNPVNAVFTMLFGSYFGDWDSQNNFQRAALASNPSILTCSWAGFPHWYFHNLAGNLSIGYATRLTQNNFSNYWGAAYSFNGINYYINNQGLYQIHVSLLGDPTLTLYPAEVAPPTNLSVVQPAGDFVHLSWNPPAEPVDGYYIYRSYKSNGEFTLINPAPVSETTFIDSSLYEGAVYYMVRSVKTIENNSGAFAKLSRGIIQNAIITSVENDELISSSLVVAPNPTSNNVNISITLAHEGIVSLEVYDSFGNIVKKFEPMYLAPGTHNIGWNLAINNGAKIQAGVYFVKLTTKNRIITQKFLKISD
jgi:hypothetical protein